MLLLMTHTNYYRVYQVQMPKNTRNVAFVYQRKLDELYAGECIRCGETAINWAYSDFDYDKHFFTTDVKETRYY